MRWIILAVGLALVASAARADLERSDFMAESVGAIYDLCTADESTSDGKYAIGYCYGWIVGVGQVYEQLLIDERFDLDPVICSKTELTWQDVRATFVAWAEANPKALGEPALSGIFDAMEEQYPCK